MDIPSKINEQEQPAAEEKLPTYGDGEIDKIIHQRVCARCYGHLVKDVDPEAPLERRWTARCLKCGTAWHGATVSRKYVERMQAQGRAEYYEVAYNPDLKDILPRREKKDPRQLLKEIGF